MSAAIERAAELNGRQKAVLQSATRIGTQRWRRIDARKKNWPRHEHDKPDGLTPMDGPSKSKIGDDNCVNHGTASKGGLGDIQTGGGPMHNYE